jgi:hypothetical protein
VVAASEARTARQIIAKFAGKNRRQRPRTGEKVRRDSRHRGERERTFWRPVDPLEARAVVEAAELEFVATKAKGKRIGSIGRSDIAILRFFASIVDWETGALEPAYTYIKYRTGLSIDCIAKCLKRLCEAGFLERLRRTQPVEDDGTGRTVEQIENAYRMLVPERWAGRVRQRIAQWRERAARAAVRWRDHAADAAEREARRSAERLTKARAWGAANISDPALRADFLADLDRQQGQSAIQLK